VREAIIAFKIRCYAALKKKKRALTKRRFWNAGWNGVLGGVTSRKALLSLGSFQSRCEALMPKSEKPGVRCAAQQESQVLRGKPLMDCKKPTMSTGTLRELVCRCKKGVLKATVQQNWPVLLQVEKRGGKNELGWLERFGPRFWGERVISRSCLPGGRDTESRGDSRRKARTRRETSDDGKDQAHPRWFTRKR